MPKQKQSIKFWNMAKVDGDTAEIILYGDICEAHPVDWWTGEKVEGLYITPEGFLEDLEVIKDAPKIIIKLNSVGGCVNTGIAIHNALKELKGHKTVIVEGIAASAASVIMCAGDEVHVLPGSIVMVHEVAGFFYGYMNVEALQLAIKAFEAYNKALAEIYRIKTGMETAELRSLMKNETWYVGQEAVDAGFADVLLSDEEPVETSLTADRKMLLVAGSAHDISAFRNVPKNIPVKDIKAIAKAKEEQRRDGLCQSAGCLTKPKAQKNNKGESETMEKIKTLDELKAAYPDLLAQAVKESETETVEATVEAAIAEAVAAERQRIKDIDEIASVVGDAALLLEAKFGEGDKSCTAEELALRAMKAQSKLGVTHLENVQKDYKASGADDVSATPNSGYAGNEADDIMAEVATVVTAYKGIKGGVKT